jgi:hypothetical protein
MLVRSRRDTISPTRPRSTASGLHITKVRFTGAAGYEPGPAKPNRRRSWDVASVNRHRCGGGSGRRRRHRGCR